MDWLIAFVVALVIVAFFAFGWVPKAVMVGGLAACVYAVIQIVRWILGLVRGRG